MQVHFRAFKSHVQGSPGPFLFSPLCGGGLEFIKQHLIKKKSITPTGQYGEDVKRTKVLQLLEVMKFASWAV